MFPFSWDEGLVQKNKYGTACISGARQILLEFLSPNVLRFVLKRLHVKEAMNCYNKIIEDYCSLSATETVVK